jgi:hypothetical protein
MVGNRVNLPDPVDSDGICKNAAHKLQGAKWDLLHPLEAELARNLIKLGYLNDSHPHNGFIGKAT